MTDIQQWRRKIQPARVRTPALETEDSDSVASPTTPRRALRPKLSSYFAQPVYLAGPSKTDIAFEEGLFSQRFDQGSADESAPSPVAENLIEAIMCRLMSDPYRGLDPRFNSMLMQIFESYRTLRDEKHLESDGRIALEAALHHSSQEWDREKHEYKAEIKRLELILAKGKRGLAEVTLARQDSVLKRGKQRNPSSDETLETIFEFLEKSKRYEDRYWSSQRATMRQRSPSAQMRRLSRTLATKSSMTNIHSELPFGTPPDVGISILTQQDASKPADIWQQAPSEPKTSMSDDSLSTFSCAGDLLPDETADVNLIQAAGTDNDFVAIKRIAHVLAKRRHVDPESVMPTLLGLFAEQSLSNERSSSLPVGLGIEVSLPNVTSPDRALHSGPLRKNPTLKLKASGFFSRFRPQLNIDTSPAYCRRFSFEAGDDTNASLSAPAMEGLPAAVRERLIRKSASMSSLETSHRRTSAQEPPLSSLSPVAQSPTNSAPPQDWAQTPPGNEDSKKPTRIPTPIFRSGSYLRPRREREDSASSLLTAIKHSGTLSRRSGSLSSSTHSSPPLSRTDLTQTPQPPDNVQGSSQRSAGSNRLLDHTNALRGSSTVVVTSKPPNVITTDVDQEMTATLSQRGSVQSIEDDRSSIQAGINSDIGELRKENHRPMGRPASNGQDSNAIR